MAPGPARTARRCFTRCRRRARTAAVGPPMPSSQLLERYPDGIAEKYHRPRAHRRSSGPMARSRRRRAAGGRYRPGVRRPALRRQAQVPRPHHVIPTIRIVAGKLPEIAAADRASIDCQGRAGLRPGRHPGRAGLRNHRCRRRTQDRHRAAAPAIHRFPAVADRRRRDLPELQPQTQCLGRCRSAVAAGAHGAGRRAAMDLPARERDHHHADPARRRIAARGSRATTRNRGSTCWRPCNYPLFPSDRPRSKPAPRSTC